MRVTIIATKSEIPVYKIPLATPSLTTRQMSTLHCLLWVSKDLPIKQEQESCGKAAKAKGH